MGDVSGLRKGNFDYLILGWGTQNFMHLGGSKKAVNLSRLWLIRHGLLMVCTWLQGQQTQWSMYLISDTMLTSLLNLWKHIANEFLRLSGTPQCHFSSQYHLTWTLDFTRFDSNFYLLVICTKVLFLFFIFSLGFCLGLWGLLISFGLEKKLLLF